MIAFFSLCSYLYSLLQLQKKLNQLLHFRSLYITGMFFFLLFMLGQILREIEM